MCVIYAAKTVLPEDSELARGATKNTDGAGIAWLSPNPKGSGAPVVSWKKGLKSAKDVKEYIRDNKIPLPLAIHFRNASAGMPAIPQLCHPFPVSDQVPTWTSGTIPGSVLFHNGFLSRWDDIALQTGLREPGTFPEGYWSDSRALAWLVSLKGKGILHFLLGTSRILLFNAQPYTFGKKAYKPEEDHFEFWGGQWIHKEGYSQSISTEFANVGGKRSFVHGSWQDDDVVACEEMSGISCGLPQAPEPPPPPKKEETTPKTGQLALTAGVGGIYDPDIWTVEELKEILEDMEKEQKLAELVTGI